MSRVIAVVAVGVAVAVTACSGGTKSIATRPVCPLFVQLAQTGRTVDRADVSDPAQFDATLRTAVASYVRTARNLRKVVPPRLRGDVDRLVAAVQQYRFQDGAAARSNLDEYSRSECGTSESTSTG